MKNKFYGYYKPSKETFDSLWDNALIVLDANILLDFYRLSKSTCDDLFEVLKTLEDRIWIPYQAANEYHKNIVNVVKSQIKQNDEALQALYAFKKFFDNKRSYPFLSDSLNKRTTKLTEELETFLQDQKEDLLKIIFEKSVKDEICDFFDGKVGDGFSDEQLKSYYKEAEDRYKSNIPPGFKDTDKNGNNKYGDFIIWCEIMSKASNDNKDILFITDDVKCDWYIEINGKRIGPHPSLLNEFRQKTNHEIYMYSLDSFLNYAKERKIKVKGKTIEEVKERKSGVVWDYAALDAMKNMSYAVFYKSMLQALGTYYHIPESQLRNMELFYRLKQQMDSYNEFQKGIATVKDSMRGWESVLEKYSQQFKALDGKKEEDNKEE